MRILTIVTVVLISVAGIFNMLEFTDQSAAQEATAQTVAQKAADKDVIRAIGTIDSAFSIPIVNQVPGTTTILSVVPAGAEVKQGDLLMQLDDSGLQRQLQQQRNAVMQARAGALKAEENLKLHMLQSEESLIAAKTSLEVAEKSKESVLGEGGELDLKQGELERELKLLKTKIEIIEKRPKNQLEADHIALQYQLTLLDLRNRIETVQEQRQHLNEHLRPLAAVKHEGEVAIAASHLKQQKAADEYQAAEFKAVLEAAQRNIKVELERLHGVEKSVADCRIVAPRDGTVVYAVAPARGRPGIGIGRGMPLRGRQRVMTLVDPENRQATMPVPKDHLDDLKVGQPAKIRVDAIPNRVFSGTVAEISDSPERARFPANIQPVTIKIDKPQPELKPGMTCQVEVDISQ